VVLGDEPQGQTPVAFFTDIEGNWEYLCACVEQSVALSFSDVSRNTLVLSDGWSVVFGGDYVDKGPCDAPGGSIRVVTVLTALKRAYPERVSLILGNRDINKMRISSELAQSEIDAIDTLPGPHWVPFNRSVTPKARLKRQISASESIDESDVADDHVYAANSLAARVQWMLVDTMGADGEFERRRAEMALLQGVGPSDVSDVDVASDFVASVQPGGWMLELLDLGELAVVRGDCLFVHGGLTDANVTCCYGRVPRSTEVYSDAREWASALNRWKASQLDEWRQQPQWSAPPAAVSVGDAAAWAAGKVALMAGPDGRVRGGEALIDYVTPGSPIPSCVYSRHLDKRGMPMQLPPDLVAQLRASGITRVVVGHTPHGVAPTIIKSELPSDTSGGVTLIMADTSYSDMRACDNRGSACCEVVLLTDGTSRVHGSMGTTCTWAVEPPKAEHEAGGTSASSSAPPAVYIDYTLAPAANWPADELVGRLEPESAIVDGKRRFVKALLEDGRFVTCFVDGFLNEYQCLTCSEALRLFGSLQTPTAQRMLAEPPARPLPMTSFHGIGDAAAIGDGSVDVAREQLLTHIFKAAALKTMMEQKREQRGSHSLLDLPQTSVFTMQPGRHQLRETIPHTGAFLKLCGAHDGAGDHEKAVLLDVLDGDGDEKIEWTRFEKSVQQAVSRGQSLRKLGRAAMTVHKLGLASRHHLLNKDESEPEPASRGKAATVSSTKAALAGNPSRWRRGGLLRRLLCCCCACGGANARVMAATPLDPVQSQSR